MSGAIEPNAQSSVLIRPFPLPGRLVQLACRELDLSNGAQDQLLPLRGLRDLPRPWDLATCETPQLRKEVWSWLQAVVTWLNHKCVWTLPTSSRCAGPSIPTWCTRSPFWQTNAAARAPASRVTPYRSGTATACQRSQNG